MEFIGTAFAQTPETGLQAGSPIGFYVVGGIIALIGLVFVWKSIAVTSGHAVIVALGVAIIALPSVADFEFRDGGFRFSTHQQVTRLADQVEALTRQEESINTAIVEMGEAMRSVTEQLAAIERAEEGQPGPEIRPGTWQGFDPTIYDRIITERQSAIELNQRRLDEINELQRELQFQR